MQVLKVDFQAADAPKQFSTSLRETGFAVIQNHDISIDLIKEVYEQWHDFFNSDDKFNYPFDSKKQDGYFPKGTEVAKGYDVADLKEFYHVYPTGRVPEYLKDATFQLRSQVYAMAKDLLQWIYDQTPEAIRQDYDMPLTEMVSNDRTLYRMIYYPALEGSEEPGAIRAASHEDINLITLLPAASADGLQVQDTRGNWHDVPCDFGNISINCGDMLSLASQGYFPATSHRVINPEGLKRGESRMSMPLFTHPKAHVLLKPGFTAEDFLDERLKEIGIRSEEGELA